MGDLAKNFSSDKMQCSCMCHICNVDKKFMEKLQKARDIASIPFKVSSGCRCPMNNKLAGGKPDSDHLTTESIQCKGVDIYCYDSRSRFLILKAALEVGFKRIGLAKTYIHLGMSEELFQEVLWMY